MYLPTEDTKNKIKYKKGTNNDQTDEINPRPLISYRIVYLK